MEYAKYLALALLFFVQPVFGADYVLTRGTVFYLDGTILDSRQPDVSFSGTMELDGGRVNQELTVTTPEGSSSLALSGTITDQANSIVKITADNGISNRVVLINCCDPIITLTQTASFSEVDQWSRADSSLSRAFSSSNEADNVDTVKSNAVPGTGGKAAATALGLTQ